MYSSDDSKNRLDKTLKAHRIILDYDKKDISGSITFHFQKGQGIVNHEIRECHKWNGTLNENKVVEFTKNI